MELVYFYIADYKNIKDQEINLGSKYIYNYMDDVGVLTRKVNPRYIPNFYKIYNEGLENISALIGENGTGKTNILHFLREALGNLIYPKHSNGNYNPNKYILIFYDNHKDKTIIVNFTDINFIDFPYEILNISLDSEIVFYSPIYDLSNYPLSHIDSVDLDVSSNHLIGFDSINQNLIINNNPIEFHKYKESERQINFVLYAQEIDEITSNIALPKTAKITIFQSRLPDENMIRNIPYAFREYLKEGTEIFYKELRILTDKLYDKNLSRIKKENSLNERNRIKLVFNFNLWLNLFYNLEISNHFLNENINGEDKIERTLGFLPYFLSFLKNQSLIPFNPINRVIEGMELIINNFLIDYDDSHMLEKTSIEVNLDCLRNFIPVYSYYLFETNKLAGFSKTGFFINFDWNGLSSGEKSYLNLFSRLMYSMKLLYEKTSLEPDLNLRNPYFIYVLIDEGELGFHPQWQKEFIFNLINNLPKILKFKLTSQPKIQLIFATHSPFSLSDLLSYNISYLSRIHGKSIVLSDVDKPKFSFAANINDLYNDSYYLKDGFMGSFAKVKINKILNEINDSQTINSEDFNRLSNLIENIDEPIIRTKLNELLNEKGTKEIKLKSLLEQEEIIREKIKQLKENDKNS